MQAAVNSRLPNNRADFVCSGECIASCVCVCVCVCVVVTGHASLPVKGIQR